MHQTLDRTPYTNDFFQDILGTAGPSAATIVPMLISMIGPSSVVDVGCGTGAWLASFDRLGVSDYLGIDGDYVDTRQLVIEKDKFQAVDLSKPLKVNRSFDLALCLEVGEHLVSSSSEDLVRSLTHLAPVVAFSAAIPSQGGTHHVNEQWPGYWAKLFNQHGFTCFDLLRPRLWDNDNVGFWYRQNMLIFASQDGIDRTPVLKTADPVACPMALVHPELLEKLLADWKQQRHWLERPGMRESLKLLFRATARRFTGSPNHDR